MSISSLSNLSSFLGGLRLDQLFGPTKGANSTQFPADLSSLLQNQPAAKTSTEPTTDPTKTSGLPFGLDELDSQASIIRAFAFSSQEANFSLQTSNGFAAQGSVRQTSLGVTLQQGENLLKLDIQVTQAVIGLTYNQASGANGNDDPSDAQGQAASFLDRILPRLSQDARGLFDQFTSGKLASDFFSPENTANRIADFALNGFGFFQGGKAAQENTAESRQRFADFIRPAIEKGFQQALDFLGNIPDPIRSRIDQTRGLIEQRFSDFLAGNKGSSDSDSNADAATAAITAAS